jgi:multidrug efflux pump subunit AcrB
VDPLLILLAVPPGLAGVVVTLALSGTSLNIMSLMGVIMMTGIVVSNSILIVEFAHRLREESSLDALTAVAMAARIRLRPVLMTSLATIFGLLPMALKLGEGSESYAPLARAILGGLLVSLLFTLFLVPSGFVLVHGRKTA